ncbi:MAG: heparinase II/III family protein [Bacteroides sp.]
MRIIVIALPLLMLAAVANAGAQRVKHPSLLYTPERIAMVKQRIDREPRVAQAWDELRGSAEEKLKSRKLNDLDYLSLAYLVTDDNRYVDCIKEILLNAIKAETWGSEEMLARKPVWRGDLGLAHKAYLTAIAFDAVYNDLTSAERKQIAEGLKRLALEPCLGDWLLEPTRIHSLNSMGHNWWTSCACMGGILALSLQNELSEAREMAGRLNEQLPEWFSFAGDVLQNKPKSFDAAGGMYESLNYANFGIQEALQFRLAWRNAMPGQPMPDIPELKPLAGYFMHVCYPRTGILHSLTFGDSHENITAESTLMLLYALGDKDDNILWYINQVEQGQHRDGYFLNRPMGFLYTPDLRKAPAEPKIGTSQLFADFGWATMRTSWQKDATMLAVKSGHTWNHSHADASSFVLYHKGVDILKDGGHCWYPNPAYRNYFFQSEAHNVVLFNGRGQSRYQQYHGSMLDGKLHYLMDGGNCRYVLADATGPYADQFHRYFRHFLWLDNVIYVIDDLGTHETGEFQWLWHPGGEARKRGFDLTVTNGASSVVVRPLYPRLLANSDFVHDYPDDLWWEIVETPSEDLKGTDSYYSFHLPGKTDRVKAVNAIILKENPDDKDLPEMERREGKDWIGLRIRHQGKVTDLYINQLADGRLMHSNSWIEADGWSTDAYMWSVSYPEGTNPADAKELFVCYGSALRREGQSYFSSLSKLFVMCQPTDGGRSVRLLMEGQPRMHASFGHLQKPASLEVNGKKLPVDYKNGNLKIIINQ